MKEIKTTDYVSEYEFRRYDGPKYQTSSLRPVIQERNLPDCKNVMICLKCASTGAHFLPVKCQEKTCNCQALNIKLRKAIGSYNDSASSHG